MPTCSVCKEEKPALRFVSATGKKTKACDACRKKGAAKFRARYDRDPAAVKQSIKRYRARNPDTYKRGRRRCERAYLKNNPQKRADKNKRYRTNQPARVSTAAAAYRARKMQATPAWANAAAIAAIYALAREHRALTGEKVTVDHIVPLKHKLVCGLHCEANLRLVDGGYNSRKRNHSWPDMPD